MTVRQRRRLIAHERASVLNIAAVLSTSVEFEDQIHSESKVMDVLVPTPINHPKKVGPSFAATLKQSQNENSTA